MGLALFVGVVSLLLWRNSGREPVPQPIPRCPLINDVSLRPFGDREVSARVERIAHDQFNDDFLYNKEGSVKVGVREQWGGSLIFFGEAADSMNTLDDSALGRGVQLRFHDEARATQRCPVDNPGWIAAQAGDRCGQGSQVDAVITQHGLMLTTIPTLLNPDWSARDCNKGCGGLVKKSQLRVTEALRFINSHVLEVEVAVTNLSDRDIHTKHGERNDFPALFARRGADNLPQLRNANGEVLSGDRVPASGANHELRIPGGWATYQNAQASYGIGIFWENHNEFVRVLEDENEVGHLSSDFAFSLPAKETVYGRYYLLLGGYDAVKRLAEDLDHTLAPFGRIELNRIEDDTRTVTLSGWVLDNKDVSSLELWIDDKKISDLTFNSQRADICQLYPGYSMCAGGHSRIGFETTYRRPEGNGCAQAVEVRARDGDGNVRVIGRKSITPVVY